MQGGNVHAILFRLSIERGRLCVTEPEVGAVVVAEGRIIGEGWHREFGGAHAEVNALDAVKTEDLHLLPQATLFVTLEPCNHFGKQYSNEQRVTLYPDIRHVQLLYKPERHSPEIRK